MNKEKYVEISNLINDAFSEIEDVLIENKVETIVAFSIGNTLGAIFERLEQLLKAEVNE